MLTTSFANSKPHRFSSRRTQFQTKTHCRIFTIRVYRGSPNAASVRPTIVCEVLTTSISTGNYSRVVRRIIVAIISTHSGYHASPKSSSCDTWPYVSQGSDASAVISELRTVCNKSISFEISRSRKIVGVGVSLWISSCQIRILIIRFLWHKVNTPLTENVDIF